MRKRSNRKVRSATGCITLRMPLKDTREVGLVLSYYASIDAFVKGEANGDNWNTLADALNMSRLMCNDGRCAEYADTVLEAQQAVMDCQARYMRLGKWGLGGPEITAIEAALPVIDAQIHGATPLYLRSVVERVQAAVSKGDVLTREAA